VNVAERASIAPKDRRVSIAPIPTVARACSVCKLPDSISAPEGEFDVLGRKRVEHTVTVELRYLKSRSECTPLLESKGWRHKIHQGRDAMERFICRPCLMAKTEMRKEFQRKRDKELGAKNYDPYYLAVCGE